MEWLYHRAGFNGLGIRRTGSNHWRQYMVSACGAAWFELRYPTWRYTITNPLCICKGLDAVSKFQARPLEKERERENNLILDSHHHIRDRGLSIRVYFKILCCWRLFLVPGLVSNFCLHKHDSTLSRIWLVALDFIKCFRRERLHRQSHTGTVRLFR